MEAEIWVSVLVGYCSKQYHESIISPLGLWASSKHHVMTQILNFSVLPFTPFLKQTMHFNSRMIVQPWRVGEVGSANRLILFAIFTNKVQLSDFLSPPKRRKPEETCLVLVMLVNYRHIIILDEKVMEAKEWKLSNPCGLQHMPLGRAHQLWLFKRKKGGNTKRETHEKWLSYLGNQGGGVCSWELIYFVCSSPKLVTQLLMEGVCTDSHGHLHRKAK